MANTAGQEPNQNYLNNGSTSFRYLQTNVYSRPLKQINENLTYVAQSDFGYQNNALLNGHHAWWYGLNQYLFYKVSDCMTYGIRAEWFRDQDGYRVGGFLGTTPTGALRGLSGNRSGYFGSFYEVTIGANYKYSANTTIRPYVRFDWFSGASTNPRRRQPRPAVRQRFWQQPDPDRLRRGYSLLTWAVTAWIAKDEQAGCRSWRHPACIFFPTDFRASSWLSPSTRQVAGRRSRRSWCRIACPDSRSRRR